MQYDFDTILDRRGRDALALDMIPYDGVEPKEGFSRIPHVGGGHELPHRAAGAGGHPGPAGPPEFRVFSAERRLL